MMAGATAAPAPDMSTVVELEAVAYRRGYRIREQEDRGWLRRRSANAPGTLWLTGRGPVGPFFIASDHEGVAREMPSITDMPHPGCAAWAAGSIRELDHLADRIFRLSVSLPDHPLEEFRKRLVEEPTLTTETEAMRTLRVGQDAFRTALMAYWQGRCPLTGITEPALLRASHIRAWADCGDVQRLDVYNGLLLSALWDAAFDRGLISFADDGSTLFAGSLGKQARDALEAGVASPAVVDLRPEHSGYLKWHRERHGYEG